jgi:hypothetical protein
MHEVITCPLGNKCREIKDNVETRCAWYIKMKGQNAIGEHIDKWDCAIAWGPVLQVEQSSHSLGMAVAFESMREATVKRQDEAIKTLMEYQNVKAIKTK